MRERDNRFDNYWRFKNLNTGEVNERRELSTNWKFIDGSFHTFQRKLFELCNITCVTNPTVFLMSIRNYQMEIREDVYEIQSGILVKYEPQIMRFKVSRQYQIV